MCISSNLTFPLDKSLSLPPQSSSYLKCTAADNSCIYNETKFIPSNLPFENGPVIQAFVSSAKVLSEGIDVKTTMEIMLNIKDFSLTFLPGDTIGILPENPEEDVLFMLERLSLNESGCLYNIEIIEGQTKKKSILPPHIPSVASARFLFQKCLDLRAVVKKVLLRSFIDYTSEDLEKRRLMELCSKEGSTEYNTQILSNKSSIIDILKAFPSCVPPLSLLIEQLPRLQPRPYSIASSPLENPDVLRIVFNVVYDSRKRRGICSGWLYDITRPFHDIAYRLNKLNLDEKSPPIMVQMYLRKPSKFQIPQDLTIPLIMIGPGTGIAPFIGFLEHRKRQLQNCTLKIFPRNLLLFGCRYPKKDEIYKDFLCSCDNLGVCKYLVCYSRDDKSEGNSLKYVQDILKKKEDDIVSQLLSTETCIFICGNGITMGKDIIETLTCCFKNVQGIPEVEAKDIVNNLEKNGRILKDLWF